MSRVLILAFLAVFAATASAGDGWVNVGGRFLKWYKDPKTFAQANAICAGQGGLIVYDDHPTISSYLAKTRVGQWIGATDAGHEGKWTWTNGASVGKGRWWPGEPNNCCGGQNCAVTNFRRPGRWDDLGCNQKRPFHCQVHRVGYAYGAGGRVLKLHTEKKTWAEANAICRVEGGELVKVDNAAVNARLAAYGMKNANLWIGATDAGHEGSWRWNDGRVATKSFWYPREPNNCCGGQNCAVVNFRQPGKWDDQGCNARNSFVCQIRL